MKVDVSNTLPEFLMEGFSDPGKDNIGYLKVFGPRWAGLIGWSKGEFMEKLEKQDIKEVMTEVMTELGKQLSMDNFLKQLDDQEVVAHAIHNMDYGRNGDEEPEDHDYVADILKKYPDRFIGFAGFNPHKGTRSLKVVRTALTEQGYKAVVIPPYEHGLQANDRRYYPLYALCEELDVPIWIHTSINYFKDTSLYIDHPSNLEQPLGDFPDLKIIAGHGGWPWVNDMIGMMLKYENLYVDTSAFRPKYIAEPNTGWDMFLYYADRMLQDRILLGTDWLTLGMPIAEVMKEFEQWPIKDSTRSKFYWENANKLFKLNLTASSEKEEGIVWQR